MGKLGEQLRGEALAMGHAANCTWTATMLAGEGSTECDCRVSRFRALADDVDALEKRELLGRAFEKPVVLIGLEHHVVDPAVPMKGFQGFRYFDPPAGDDDAKL